jgi:NADH-quinone oxidoreductase subunit A
MLAQYLPILIFLCVSTIIGVALVILGNLLGPKRPDSEKLSPYECGFEAFEDSRTKFDVRYYLVAILFIIFDLEITFFLPWALALDTLGMFGVAAMFVFVIELVIGYFVIWKRGALEWE